MNVAIALDDAPLNAFLGRLVELGARPPMRAIGHILTENTRLRFREGRSPEGQAWAPLSPVTIARRRKGSSTPLMDTGRLRNSITFVEEGANAVVVGTNVRYGRMQHFGAAKGAFGQMSNGAPIPWGDVPGRPYLGVSHEDRVELFNLLHGMYSGLV